MNAPTNSPAEVPRHICDHLIAPLIANPSVTAGFRCAPPNRPTAKHGHRHRHAPPERDHDPAAVLGLRLLQQHGSHDAVAQQDQDRRPDDLGAEGAQAPSSSTIDRPFARATI